MRNKFLIGLIVITLFSVILISSAWPLGKLATCSILNVTGNSCDEIWCGVIDCTYDINRTACICYEGTNITLMTINSTDFYNKTEIDNKLINISANQSSDLINRTELIEVKNSILNSIENRTRELINAYMPKDYSGNSSQPVPTYVFVVGIIAVALVIMFVVWSKMQESKLKAEHPSKIQGFKRKINPTEFYGEPVQTPIQEQKPVQEEKFEKMTKEEKELLRKLQKISEQEKQLREEETEENYEEE